MKNDECDMGYWFIRAGRGIGAYHLSPRLSFVAISAERAYRPDLVCRLIFATRPSPCRAGASGASQGGDDASHRRNGGSDLVRRPHRRLADSSCAPSCSPSISNALLVVQAPASLLSGRNYSCRGSVADLCPQSFYVVSIWLGYAQLSSSGRCSMASAALAPHSAFWRMGIQSARQCGDRHDAPLIHQRSIVHQLDQRSRLHHCFVRDL